MIEPYDAETLALHIERVRIRTEALNTAIEGRDAQIRGMLSKGAQPTELGRLAGLSRERIYQIKDK